MWNSVEFSENISDIMLNWKFYIIFEEFEGILKTQNGIQIHSDKSSIKDEESTQNVAKKKSSYSGIHSMDAC